VVATDSPYADVGGDPILRPGGLGHRSRRHPWAGLAVGVIAVVVYGAQNRYLIAEAHVDDDLRLRFLGGRELVLDPRTVELTKQSAWRVLWGGWALVTIEKRICLGVFYPTIEWVDLERLDQRLGPDGLH
jgi:hypothetical protein